MFSADWTTFIGDKFLVLVWCAWCTFSLGLHDHAVTLCVLRTGVCVAQTLVPCGADSLLFFVVQAVWFITNAATADGITQIFVEQLLSLFLALLFRNATYLRAHLAALDAVTSSAGSDVPALSIGVCNVSFYARALSRLDAFLTVPYGVEWTGAAWRAV